MGPLHLKGDLMRLLSALLLATIAAPAIHAQMPPPPPPVVTDNPVVWSANQMYARNAKNIVAAAEEMPEDKYSFKPTPDQITFGQIVSHLASSNGGLCAILSGNPAPAETKVPGTAPKADLVAALKASFTFCDATMDKLKDAQLGDQVTFFRGAKVPRARALIEITGDLEDHYSQMAGYLRLSGLLPPSAQPRK
jgi:hypothetical protein